MSGIGFNLTIPFSYANTTVENIYSVSIVHSPGFSAAARWVEAENIMAVRALIIQWFKWLEDGTAANIYPDPLGDASITPERADKLVEELDADFDLESGRWYGLQKTTGPGFSRLKLHSRLAFAQEVFAVMKTNDQIREEAKRRVAAGEKIPPPEADPYDQPAPNIDGEGQEAQPVLNWWDYA